MKKTTYILAGVIIFGAISIVGIIVWLHFNSSKNSALNIAGDVKTIALQQVKTLIFEYDEDSQDRAIDILGNVNIRQAKGDESGSVSYPSELEKYMEVTTKDSVTVVKFKVSDGQGAYNSLHIAEAIKIVIPTSVDAVDNNVMATMNINGYTNDSFEFKTLGKAQIDNLHVKDLKLDCIGYVKLNSGRAENLHVTSNNSWEVDVAKFSIDTEYLSGGNFNIQKGECKKVVFVPEKPSDELNIRIVQPATIMLNE